MARTRRPPPRFIDSAYDFFKLPPELRCKIYRFLMNDPEPAADYSVAKAGKLSFDAKALSSQFLRTCKVIYEEAIAVLYKIRMIEASDFSLLEGPLTTIGTFSCTFIRIIMISPEPALPPYMTQNNKRELLGLDADEGLVFRPRRLPQLPNLRIVMIRYLIAHIDDEQDPDDTEEEKFVAALIRSKPCQGHFLCEYMWMFGHPAMMMWRLDFTSVFWELNESNAYVVKEERMIDVRAEVATGTKYGKAFCQWVVKNKDASVGEDIMIWKMDKCVL